MNMQTGVRGLTGGGVLGIGTGRVVALLADLPAGVVPNLMQILQGRLENGFGIAPDLNLADTDLDGRVGRTGFADEMAMLAQTMLAQGLHDFATLRRAH